MRCIATPNTSRGRDTAIEANDPPYHVSPELGLVTAFQSFADLFFAATSLRLVNQRAAASPIIVQDTTGLDLSARLIRKVFDIYAAPAFRFIENQRISCVSGRSTEDCAAVVRDLVPSSHKRSQIIVLEDWDDSRSDHASFLTALMAVRTHRQIVVIAAGTLAKPDLAGRLTALSSYCVSAPTTIGIVDDPVRHWVEARLLPASAQATSYA